MVMVSSSGENAVYADQVEKVKNGADFQLSAQGDNFLASDDRSGSLYFWDSISMGAVSAIDDFFM